jgi:hypothetical protein
MATVAYWAVPCRTCGGRVALALIEFDSQKEPIEPILKGPLRVGCALCRSEKMYAPYEVTAWEGFSSVNTFVPHPDFQHKPVSTRQ